MPQLLSKVLRTKDYSINFSADCLQQKPDLAALVAEGIARWSTIESGLTRLLITILGAHAEPGFAMFSALRAPRARLDALLAAADTALNEDDLELFKTTHAVIRSQKNERLRLAHWIWGQTPEIPDALLLAKPEAISELFVKSAKQQAAFVAGEFPRIPLDKIATYFQFNLDKIYVYKKSDLERINRDFKEAAEILNLAAVILDPPPYPGMSRDELFPRLSSLRLYHEATIRRQEGRKNSPEAPP